jgi:hypothetical protein
MWRSEIRSSIPSVGFDPTRFQTEPPACYRASWQLPGGTHTRWRRRAMLVLVYISTSNSGARPDGTGGKEKTERLAASERGPTIANGRVESQQAFGLKEDPFRAPGRGLVSEGVRGSRRLLFATKAGSASPCR